MPQTPYQVLTHIHDQRCGLTRRSTHLDIQVLTPEGLKVCGACIMWASLLQCESPAAWHTAEVLLLASPAAGFHHAPSNRAMSPLLQRSTNCG